MAVGSRHLQQLQAGAAGGVSLRIPMMTQHQVPREIPPGWGDQQQRMGPLFKGMGSRRRDRQRWAGAWAGGRWRGVGSGGRG